MDMVTRAELDHSAKQTTTIAAPGTQKTMVMTKILEAGTTIAMTETKGGGTKMKNPLTTRTS